MVVVVEVIAEVVEVELRRWRGEIVQWNYLQIRSLEAPVPDLLFHFAFASGTSLRAKAADFITKSFTETFAFKSCIIN